jgi:RHH-type proline utilization regulon transcriptional repressor/proline dehydrogenase/delta 1-pyrroline-5-carboxylate dehydrogenase
MTRDVPPPDIDSPLRAAMIDAYREDETTAVHRLLDSIEISSASAEKIASRARALVIAVRENRSGATGVDHLMQEFSLSSQEGVALMCLAEAMLRIPDTGTVDRLIRDKLAGGDWSSHLGQSQSLFVNAATWGLLITGKLVATANERSMSRALTRLIAKGGEPLIRRAVDLAMRMLGRQFVTGETIGAALEASREPEARGYRYSYDMLGEAALTAADAERYCRAYEGAIDAIGKASAGRGIYDGPGISIKLSALHPRYHRAQRERVLTELKPRLKALMARARQWNIGLNIDAEEADRLMLSLDLFEPLALDSDLADWDGLGFVVALLSPVWMKLVAIPAVNSVPALQDAGALPVANTSLYPLTPLPESLAPGQLRAICLLPGVAPSAPSVGTVLSILTSALLVASTLPTLSLERKRT